MSHEAGHLGWLKYTTESEANNLISSINTCLGFPTPDGKTTTWAVPSCLQNDYEGSETESGWFVIIKDECYDCLSQAEKDEVINTLPYYIACGTPSPNPSGDTENNL
jgi:hypothetical protein